MTQPDLFVGSNSQSAAILEYLRRGNALTPLEALDRFGCFRLGARVWELKQAGYRIVTQMIAVGERSGKIDSILESLSRFYAREVETMVANLTTLIEQSPHLKWWGGCLRYGHLDPHRFRPTYRFLCSGRFGGSVRLHYRLIRSGRLSLKHIL